MATLACTESTARCATPLPGSSSPRCLFQESQKKLETYYSKCTQVTVVGVDGRLVYESLVLPDSQVADYNTRFSGITQKDLGE